MPEYPFWNEPWFAYGVLPLAIILARVVDVSLGTMRIIFVARGHKLLAPIMGFFEVLIWVLAVGQVFKNLTNPVCLVAYGLGFATGNYVGMVIEERLATGLVSLRVITQHEAGPLSDLLREQGFGVTTIDAEGKMGPVTVLYVVLPRKQLQGVIDTVEQCNPKAFYSVEQVRRVSGGTYPTALGGDMWFRRLLRPARKGK
ncbi:MAG TPA: DUF2179 domain-containing protein [Phycisphaerae bacterium]|nr:DUF2179 domain-containing protein [Phycisphaerae bacterium]HOI53940.1 DUF2179 domain-containing protein [Phycisphaerae bacterium]